MFKKDDKPKKPDMDPAEIRVALLREGVSQSAIARTLKVTPSMISRVIDGVVVSHRVRSAIANAAKLDIRMVWPSTYIVKGGPQKAGRPHTGECGEKC